MRLPRAIVLVALAALLAMAQPAAAAKPKAVTCKAGQVKVKAGKKKARCRSVRAVLPKPRAVDPRVAFVQWALNLPVPKGKKARSAKRRTKSLRRGFGRAGKRAYKKMLAPCRRRSPRPTPARPDARPQGSPGSRRRARVGRTPTCWAATRPAKAASSRRRA